MGRKKAKIQEGCVEDLVSNAFSEIEQLKDELQDWYDGMSENLQGGSKAEMLTEAISCLEQDSEPEVPECASDLRAKYGELGGRRLSRADRCVNAIAMASAAADVCRTKAGELADEEKKENDQAELETLADELDGAVANWEGAEFPGMYG